MIENLYILGAGASADAGVPVMTNFIDTAEDLLDGRNFRDKQEFTALFDKIKSLNSVHAKSQINLNNIESVLGLLEMSELLKYNYKEEGSPFKSLKESYIKMIAETIELSMTYTINNNGLIISKGSYQKLGEILSDENKRKTSAVISFNYDIGIDLALHNNNIPFSYFLDDSTTDQFPLLKLHGSLNWFKNGDQGIKIIQLYQLVNSNIILQSKANTIIRIPINRLINEPTNRALYPEMDRTSFIIPPTWNKTMYHEHIHNVWQKASACLSEAKNIFVIGYSLPETDAFFTYLFSLGTNSPTRVRKFWVINPDPSVEERYRKLLGPQMIERFRFIKSDFNSALGELSSV